MQHGQPMNKSLSLVIAFWLLGGSAVGRPAQAYLTHQSSLTDVVTTADWQSPSTSLYINQLELGSPDFNLMENWIECSEINAELTENVEQNIVLDSTTSINCLQKQLVFAPTQLRTINIKYQLSMLSSIEVDESPLVDFYWNDQVIAWLTFSTTTANWVTLPIPGSELSGTLSIKLNDSRVLPLQTQLVIEQITYARLLMLPIDEISIVSDEPQALVFVTQDPSQTPSSQVGRVNMAATDLPEEGNLTFWSVDAWGNTETPKTVMFQIIDDQIPAPQLLWQRYQDNQLLLVIRTNTQLSQLISHYQLSAADEVISSQLQQPWVRATQAMHQSGGIISLSFPFTSNPHIARLQAVDQLGSASLASDLILF